MARQTLYRFIPSTVVPSAARAAAQNAKVYQFPASAVTYPADIRVDDPTLDEMGTHPAPAIEIAAVVLAFAGWLAWRVTHLFAGSR